MWNVLLLQKLKTAVRNWINTSPSTRNPSLIKYHINQIGLINYLKGNYYRDEYYSYTNQLKHAYGELADIISPYITGKSLIDIGCGSGLLLHLITQRRPLESYIGVDFKQNPDHIAYQSVRNHYHYLDLTSPQRKTMKMETGLCVEVLEHIHRKKMDLVIQNIERLVQKRLILSVAKPGQWGDGHITCMPKSWWIAKFTKSSFSYNGPLTQELNKKISRNNTIMKEMAWIRNNFLVFDKQ